MKVRFDYDSDNGILTNLEVSINGVDYDKIPIGKTSLQENLSDAIQKYLDDLAYNDWLDI